MFTFKGIHADSYKVVVNKLPPFTIAQKAVREYKIEGSDKTEVEELGYQSYVLPYEITLKDSDELDNVLAWLSGSGVLIRDDDNNKYLNAKVYSEVNLQKFKTIATGSVEFYINNPFRYALNETDTIITVSPTIYTNQGTYYSEPTLEITGSGGVEISINGRSFQYNFDTDTKVLIDTSKKDASWNGVLKNRQMTGDFPILDVGTNNISWTGTITEIVLTPKTRWL